MTATTCPKHKELVLLATDAINSEEKVALESHVAACSACRQELLTLQTTLATLPDNTRAITSAEVATFTNRVMTAASPVNQRAYYWGSAATVAVAGLLAFFIFQPGSLPVPNSIDRPLAHELAILNDFDLINNLELLEDLELLELLEDSG